MEEKYKSVNCETNHCAITGAASFFCAIKDAVILVNGSRFCFKQMLHNLEKTFRQPVRSRLFCTELQEESIIFGTEALLERELGKIKEKRNPSILFIQNNCAASLIGDDVASIAQRCGFSCPVIVSDSGGLEGGFYEGWRQAAKAFFQAFPLTDAPVNPLSVNLVGVSDSLFNFTNDKKEILSLLETGGIHTVNLVGGNMTLANLQKLRTAALNVVIFPELGKELAEFLYEEYGTPYLITLPPYGMEGSERWLLQIMKTLHFPDSEAEAVHAFFTAQKAELKTEAGKLRKIFGDLWIAEINIAGPYSTVYGIAEALRTELANYETMNLFVYDDSPDYLSLANEKQYRRHRYFDPKLIGQSPDWVLFSSSAEHALTVSTEMHVSQDGHISQHRQTGNSFCCIAYPCFDAAVFQPYMGINGCRNLSRFLWQYYIDYIRKA